MSCIGTSFDRFDAETNPEVPVPAAAGDRYRCCMANKEEAGLGTQIVVAVVILVIAWIVLRWVVRVVVGVATSLVVLGAIVAVAWFVLRGQQDKT